MLCNLGQLQTARPSALPCETRGGKRRGAGVRGKCLSRSRGPHRFPERWSHRPQRMRVPGHPHWPGPLFGARTQSSWPLTVAAVTLPAGASCRTDACNRGNEQREAQGAQEQNDELRGGAPSER